MVQSGFKCMNPIFLLLEVISHIFLDTFLYDSEKIHFRSTYATTIRDSRYAREREFLKAVCISVIINYNAHKDSDDHLEASENKVRHLSSIYVEYACDCEFRWWTNPAVSISLVQGCNLSSVHLVQSF